MVCGCTDLSDYRDARETGAISPDAHLRGAGCVTLGSELTLGGVEPQAGTFILVAGEQPILTQAVAANDDVSAEIHGPLFGPCNIVLVVNGKSVRQATSKVEAYRAYFVADAAG